MDPLCHPTDDICKDLLLFGVNAAINIYFDILLIFQLLSLNVYKKISLNVVHNIDFSHFTETKN